MVLIQEQARGEMAESFICKSGGSEQLQALDLSKMGSLPKREQVQKFRNIISANLAVSARQIEAREKHYSVTRLTERHDRGFLRGS